MAYLFPQARGERELTQSQNTQAFAHSWKRSYLNNPDFDVTNQWIYALSSSAVPPSSSSTPSYCSPAPLWEGGGSFLNPTVRSNSTANQCLVLFPSSCAGVESLGMRLLTVSFLFIWQQHSLCPLVIVHNGYSKLAVQSTSCSFIISHCRYTWQECRMAILLHKHSPMLLSSPVTCSYMSFSSCKRPYIMYHGMECKSVWFQMAMHLGRHGGTSTGDSSFLILVIYAFDTSTLFWASLRVPFSCGNSDFSKTQ